MNTVDFSYFPSAAVEEEVKKNVTKCMEDLQSGGSSDGGYEGQSGSENSGGWGNSASEFSHSDLQHNSGHHRQTASGHPRQSSASNYFHQINEPVDHTIKSSHVFLQNHNDYHSTHHHTKHHITKAHLPYHIGMSNFNTGLKDHLISVHRRRKSEGKTNSEENRLFNENFERWIKPITEHIPFWHNWLPSGNDENNSDPNADNENSHSLHSKNSVEQSSEAEQRYRDEYRRELREYLRHYLQKIGIQADSTPLECWPAWQEAKHVFGSGPVESVRGYDTIKFGDWRTKSPDIPDMSFWMIRNHHIDAWDHQAKFSAILGLGPRDHVPIIDTNGEQVETMLERANVNNFSICLKRQSHSEVMDDSASDTPHLPTGELIFNAHQTQLNPKQLRVVGLMHWAVNMVTFGTQHTNHNSGQKPPSNHCKGGCAAIIDSGTSLIAAPTSVIEAIATEVNLSQNCEGIEDLPNLEFQLGEGNFTKTFILPPSAYVVKLKGYTDTTSIFEWWMGKSKMETTTVCSLAFMPMDTADKTWGPVYILGMNFLRYYKTTYVREKDNCPPKMYFNEVDHNCKSITSSQAEVNYASESSESAAERSSNGNSNANGPSFLVQKQSRLKSQMKMKYGTIAVNGRVRARTKDEVTPLDIDPRHVRLPDWAVKMKNNMNYVL